MGIPAIFIRLAGCSLKCSYCDSKKAWKKGQDKALAEVMRRVLELKKLYPAERIVITGGEPLEQDILALTANLKSHFTTIALETNGLFFQALPVDWWTVSPKSESGFYIHPQLIPLISEIKLIANDNLPIDVIKKIRLLADDFPIIIQPEHGYSRKYKFAVALFTKLVVSGIPNIRLGIQLQRIYRIS